MELWVAELQGGRPEAAWDLFLNRYRRLIFAAIRHYAEDHDDVMDVFARVCEAMREKDFARLRRCASRVDPNRPFSTWLFTVVHNLTIDWFRHLNGRPRLNALAAALPPVQRRIFQYVFLEQRSHVEAYELARSRDGADFTFGDFLKELAATYRAATALNGRVAVALAVPPPSENSDPPSDPAELAEQQGILAAALEALPPEDRLAVRLYVVDRMPAEQVARALGYPSVKTIYNHVYRALAEIRTHLERAGIKEGDL